MSSDEDIILACAAFICMKSVLKKKKRKARRWWMASLFQNRSISAATDLLYDIRKGDARHFNACCRVPREVFDELLEMLTSKIQKEDTRYRSAIPASERLAVTLNFLATGNSYSSLALTFKISKQSISNIVPEVCAAIIDVLKDYVKTPESEEEWLKVAQTYEEKWNFPHCVGAISSRHVQIQVPIQVPNTIKSTFNIVLVAVVDADYNFLHADVVCAGRISDTNVFKNCAFFKKLEGNAFKLPPLSILPGREKLVPYVFVADDAFPLVPNLVLKLYSEKNEKDSARRVYNRQLLRTQRIVENVFGIMTTVFRVLQKPMILEPKKAEIIVMACIYLHNYLRKNPSSQNVYNPNGTFDCEINGKLINGTWRQHCNENSLQRFERVDRKLSKRGEEIRTEFAEYFMSKRVL
ncbi:uncharacterized protein LOC122404736 [Colletes gigas]|uniref:uncharacterized protein LOC122404736 n=1 Tax=Colletes gigas TaxID=935657 RepID=UPI001C9AF881|nr:uncharacterized protein LOC122404736 [Colletes gigas]